MFVLWNVGKVRKVKNMKILLINPPHWIDTHIHNNQNCGLGLLYIASQLNEHTVKILDAEAKGMNYGQLRNYIKDYNPDVVGVTATTLSFKAMIKTCKIARDVNKDVQIAIGGNHVSATPEKSLALTGANCAVVGEGEKVANKIIDAQGICYGSSLTDKELSDIHLPRQLHDPNIGSNVYIGNDPKYGTPETVVMWERGCPHNCNFCSTRVVHGRIMRQRTIESIIEELDEMKNNGIKGLFVYDDELIGVTQKQYDWLMNLLDEIIKWEFNIDFKTQGRCSKEFITDELLEKMKEVGFKGLMMGCESGSQRVLDEIGKNLTIEDIEYSIKKISEHGMDAFCYWMIGNKTETNKDVQMTYDLKKKLSNYTKYHHVTILNPLVGTPIYEEALANGWIMNHNFNTWSQHGEVVMENPEWMTAKEIKDWERKLIEG